MKKRCAGLAALLLLLGATGIGNPVPMTITSGVLDPKLLVTRIDSVRLWPPGTTFLTPGWGSHLPLDSHDFTAPTSPETLVLHGNAGPFPFHRTILRPDTSTWYWLCIGVNPPGVKFYDSRYGVIEESKLVVERLPRLAVSPSVVTEQMTVRLQPSGTGRQVVQIHDAAGNVVRSLDFTAGTDGAATATWNREDGFGRLVPEGVYFCRYATADVVAVRKVLVAR
jgi:hypothetical protein